nr:hypothetical protein [Tanacetum cinerariifolium]
KNPKEYTKLLKIPVRLKLCRRSFFNSRCKSTPVYAVGQISTNSTNTFSADGPSNTTVSPTLGKSLYVDPSQYPDDPNIPALEDITYSDDEEDVGAEADFSNLETTVIMDVKSAFLYGTIEKEAYVCQPPGFKDPDYLDKRGKIDQTLFIKKQKGDILLDQKPDGIFISHDKYVAKILRKFGLTDGKSASTPIDTGKPSLKDPDGEDVDVYTYRKKVLITEDTVRQALHLDDAKSIVCLPNEEIFIGLARMGYEKPSTKLTFISLVRNADSSSKFYMYPRFLQLMISTQVGDLSSHTTKYTSPALTQKVFANMRRVGKRFSRVDTPLFEGMLVPQQAADDLADVDKIAQAIEITKLKQRVRKLENKRKLKFSRLKRLRKVGGKIVELDADEDVTLEEVAAVTKGAEVAKNNVNAQGRQEESQAQVYHIDLEHVDKVLSMHDEETGPVELKEVIEVVTTAKLMTEVVTVAATIITAASSAARRRKGVVIRDPEETATPSTIVHSEPKSKDKGKGILIEEPKPLKKQAQIEQDGAYAKELEAELNKNINWDDVIEKARKNIMVYLKIMAGFKMDFFRDMSYDDIRPIFGKHFNSIVGFLEKGEEPLEEEASKALKRKSESSKQQAAKKQKLDEEMILLVERRYPLTRFTLDQMLNNVRLEFEEESEVSLELLRFTSRIYSKGLLLLVEDLLLLDKDMQESKDPQLGYNAVPPPHTGLFPPLKSDLSSTRLEELFNEPKTKKLKDKSNDVEPESVRKVSDVPIIEDWASDDEEEKVEKKEVKPSIKRINFVKATTDNNPRETIKNDEQPKQNTHRKRGNQRN